MSNLRYSACCCFAGSIDHYKTCLATGQSTKLPSKVNPTKVNWKSSFWIGTRIKFIGTCDWWLEFWDTSGRDSPFNRAQISNRPPKGQKNSVFDSNLEVSIDGDTQNGWFTMESPIKMDDLGVPPWLRKHPFGWNLRNAHFGFPKFWVSTKLPIIFWKEGASCLVCVWSSAASIFVSWCNSPMWVCLRAGPKSIV